MFESDYYQFCAMADDGVRVWVDDALVLDRWYDNQGIVYCKTLRMTEGVHQVHAEYYENRIDAFVYVWWKEALPQRWY